jgi:hypothetical protein
MSRRDGAEEDDLLDYDERSRKWREDHELEPYALEYEDEAVDLDDE